MRRRDVLLFSAGGILASAGAAGWWAATREPLAALAPWREAALDADDPRIGVFRHAILAPNPHNRQPWLIRLIDADTAEIRCDLGKRLPATDPFDRQIVIGFGCFLELARLAAAARGLRLDIAPFPDGAGDPRLDGRPIARLTFRADPTLARDPLFAAIPARRSVKEPFDPARPVSAEALARLLASAGIAPDVTAMGTVDAARVAPLRDLALRAWRIEAATPTAWRESVDLMRIGKAEIEAAPDGIDLGGPMFEALSHARLVTRATLADTGSTAFREGARAYEAMFATSMGFVWLATRANARTDQLAAGAAYVRLNLAATAMGVSLHPVSQALQEFPEMAGPRAEAGALAPGARVQMLARIGYADPVPPSPRWPLAAKLTKA
ncbi:MAG: nitroreductase family protein [Azospirillum sp.]|nr:nitroreductase family protein [Azospirillum sp.]MCA3267632.1 nitroreductase family protein [Azospirillum sp.]MCZ8122831.1 nitroreductase family protein [Magnetospirillum sp.]